jgi:hypothetical protein
VINQGKLAAAEADARRWQATAADLEQQLQAAAQERDAVRKLTIENLVLLAECLLEVGKLTERR